MYCDEIIKTQAEHNLIADSISISSDYYEIKRAYDVYIDNFIILLAISKNVFSPDDVLNELLNIKNIKFAEKIRNNSRETLFIKKLFIDC